MGLKSYESSSGGAGKRFPGQYILKPTSKLKQYSMSYSEGRTLFRPWGDILADGSMAPWRDNEGKFGTSWFVQEQIIQAWGKDSKVSAIAPCEDEHNWQTGSPIQLVWDEVKYNEKFKHLTQRVNASWPVIGSPKHVGFLKGLLIENNGKSHAQQPIWGVCLIISSSAREALDDLLNTYASAQAPAQASADDPYGHNTKYFVGDPIGPQCGKIFEFNKESKLANASVSDINLDEPAGRSRGENADVIERYGCRIFPDKPVLPIPASRAAKFDETFGSALWYMTGEQQITNVLIKALGIAHKDLLMYVFGGKSVLPASFEFGRTTVDMQAPKGTMTAKAEQAGMAAQPAAGGMDINMDADDGSDDTLPSSEGTEGAPWEGKEAAADKPVMVPPAQDFTPPTSNKPAGSTADAIRARLAAASKK